MDDQSRPGAVRPGAERPLRADARRNRARVLEVANAVFAAEGLSVPVHEIARRAGVGTGTVSRHFPTKEALFAAVLADRLERYVARADELAAADDPGAAFFDYFAFLVEEGALDRGLTDALVGSGFDKSTLAGEGRDVMGALGRLLSRAQAAGAVRGDVGLPEVQALLVGCLSGRGGQEGAEAGRRMVAVVRDGLRAGG
ncbi:TetR/AcrR family transcriptional regulator; helix-turn-helix transcriptional regulator [Streptomonospora sp. S1-112]|uniref:TetR/AcrR family transcriptional regulator helix-turn-helix transcriptional regulator n=1 Tax=Streptomonospora mangrovi TaxID=2883123 RepID=A0A9X3SS88_9ACTN|nr:TetR/AcrR family transcriptional regulator [Streptomonospora mangrovi]MDA0567851.1 TetR/AcrR family transcriptional regulator; helix-turn-helix transcriptional regulator [Streptomonospora mangrovi]